MSKCTFCLFLLLFVGCRTPPAGENSFRIRSTASYNRFDETVHFSNTRMTWLSGRQIQMELSSPSPSMETGSMGQVLKLSIVLDSGDQIPGPGRFSCRHSTGRSCMVEIRTRSGSFVLDNNLDGFVRVTGLQNPGIEGEVMIEGTDLSVMGSFSVLPEGWGTATQ